MLLIFGPDQGMVEKTGFAIRIVLEAERFIDVVIGLVWTPKQRGSVFKMKLDASLEMETTAKKRSCRNEHGPAAGAVACVDRGLNGLGIIRFAVALRSEMHDIHGSRAGPFCSGASAADAAVTPLSTPPTAREFLTNCRRGMFSCMCSSSVAGLPRHLIAFFYH